LTTYRYEWCEPTLLHLNQLTCIDDDAAELKLRGVERGLGIELPRGTPCVDIIKSQFLPFFQPRTTGPMKLTPIKGTPRTHDNVSRFNLAIHAWQSAALPLRSDEEIEFIFGTCCQKCAELHNNVCGACGSALRGDELSILEQLTPLADKPILNKIRMATEHCPNWQW
jgi:hypothetical protein